MGGIVMPEVYRVPIPAPYPSSDEIFEAMEEFLRLHLFTGEESFEGLFLDEDRGIHRESLGVVPAYISAWTKPVTDLDPCYIVVRWVDTEHNGTRGSIISLKIEQQW